MGLVCGTIPTPMPVGEQSLFEYHLYTLPRRTTVPTNQTNKSNCSPPPTSRWTKTLELRGSRTTTVSRGPTSAPS